MTAILRYPFPIILATSVKMALTCFAGGVLSAFAAKRAIEIYANTKQSNH